MRVRRLFIIVKVFFLLFFVLAGCGFKDIDKRIFIMGIGIDVTDDEKNPYKVTLKLAVPTGSLKESGANYTYISKHGNSLAETIQYLKTHSDKELDFGHLRTIILSEKVVKRNIEEVLDFFRRRRDIQMISYIAVGQPSAEKIIKTEPKSEMAGSMSLINFFSDNAVESSYIVQTHLFDFVRRMKESGYDPIMPIIKMDENDDGLVVNQSIIINGKNNFITLSEEQTKYYNILSKGTKKLNVTVTQEDLTFTMYIDTINSKFKIITNKGKPYINVNVDVIGIIEETNQKLQDEKLEEYSKIVKKEMEKQVSSLLKYFQENKADPLGFGLRYKATRLHTYNTEQKWKELYPEIDFKVHINPKIKSTGTVE
ncbi:Ger(x)C family spore germination protein [Bacillus kwashiorkori]|uniref:Ger(x)C family spore germination protein n=1 Tax=Bacillus kwashiorkori TaxID=1522318 RepID=UPI000786077D|nr:Ger(x)C family spore germination protein [Bacillus kwashiorkori]